MPKGVAKNPEKKRSILSNRMKRNNPMKDEAIKERKLKTYRYHNQEKRDLISVRTREGNSGTSWNDGLTKLSDLRVEKYASKLRGIPKKEETIDKIRDARSNQEFTRVSSQEFKLRAVLDLLRISYIPQYKVYKKELKFLTFIDIYIPIAKLAIYVDGVWVHSLPGYKERDERANTILKDYDYKIFRISDIEIDNHLFLSTLKVLFSIVIGIVS